MYKNEDNFKMIWIIIEASLKNPLISKLLASFKKCIYKIRRIVELWFIDWSIDRFNLLYSHATSINMKQKAHDYKNCVFQSIFK